MLSSRDVILLVLKRFLTKSLVRLLVGVLLNLCKLYGISCTTRNRSIRVIVVLDLSIGNDNNNNNIDEKCMHAYILIHEFTKLIPFTKLLRV